MNSPLITREVSGGGETVRGVAARRQAALLPGDTLGDTFRIVRMIGSGSMGQVYEAAHIRLNGRFAIKILHPHRTTDERAVARFQREAEIASALQHPNIAAIVGFDRTAEGVPYLAMEYVAGRELTEVIGDDGPLPIDRVLNIVDQIASALFMLHGRAIIHRDLKPQNILLVAAQPPNAEQVKLVDFGISKVPLPSVALTSESAILGTPQYMAPEQARAGNDVGPGADQFALAAVVYEMLTGRKAFNGDRTETVVYRIIHEEPAPLGVGHGPALAAALRRAFSKDERQRFASVLDFAFALRAAALRDTQPIAATLERERPLLSPPAGDAAAEGVFAQRAPGGRWRRCRPPQNRAAATSLHNLADGRPRRPGMCR